MIYSQYTRQIIARSFLVIFTLMLLNGVVFRHAHKLSSGKVITHAHPYKPVGDAPYQPNGHTNNELLLLDLASNGWFALAPVVAVLLLSVAFFAFQKSAFFHYLASFLQRIQVHISLRGPPVLS
ncbi:MAG: hypothetical protein EAZ50_13660 [Runella slithyformis]|nr:MAG: hypothetical protein EAZ50_13660 [Runella slithyformis]